MAGNGFTCVQVLIHTQGVPSLMCIPESFKGADLAASLRGQTFPAAMVYLGG